MHRRLPALAIATAIAMPVAAQTATPTRITVYRDTGTALFQAHAGPVDAGHAIVHEQRQVNLEAGTHRQVLDELPDFIDPEAVQLEFPAGQATVLSQRILLPVTGNQRLAANTGAQVAVLGIDGQTLAQGTLLHVNTNGWLVIGHGTDTRTVVHQYAAIRLTGTHPPRGARLELQVQADKGGTTPATLSYPTAGLGWRAIYTGTLAAGGDTCQLRLSSMASIANHSGRRWRDAHLRLIAGAPNFASPRQPRPLMMRAMVAKAGAPAPVPEQTTLGDYHAYTLPHPVTLPAGSITQAPLYTPHTVPCERTWVFENGHAGTPAHPLTLPGSDAMQRAPVVSTLRFTAFDSLPAGQARIESASADGYAGFLGAAQIDDTPKGQPVSITLGNAFDITGTRTRTAFHVDAAAHTMTESFRVTLANAGTHARTVTVREHPDRWRAWTLAASSIPPAKQLPDLLEFHVEVPAGGKQTLDYTVRYEWTAADER